MQEFLGDGERIVWSWVKHTPEDALGPEDHPARENRVNARVQQI